MPGIQDFRKMADEEILKEVDRLLGQFHVTETMPGVSFYQLELTRRTIVQLRDSSGRLEKLTKALIAATVVLLVAAVFPVVDVLLRLWPR